VSSLTAFESVCARVMAALKKTMSATLRQSMHQSWHLEASRWAPVTTVAWACRQAVGHTCTSATGGRASREQQTAPRL
jgi:hypothetical protein